MKIIDTHVHLGWDYVFDEGQTEEQILQYGEKNGIYGGIVQPFIPRPYLKDTMEIHDRIKAFCDANPTYYGMASISPHFNYADYERELERCVKQLGFKGVKITTIGHPCDPCSKDAYHVYECARGLNIPVMIHTGAGYPFADPMKLEKPLRDYPDVKFVIAHAGQDLYHFLAIQMCQRFPNAYLEPSWCSVVSLENMRNKVGASRIMFSADVVPNQEPEITKYNCVFSGDELEQVYHRTAEAVFGLM